MRLPSGPLSKSYLSAVILVVSCLVPFLLLTAAMLPLAKEISQSLGLSEHGFDLTVSMSDGAYALGTVLAVQLAVHLPARRLLLVYVSLFLVSALLAASAPDKGIFVGAIITEGLCTSLMLIAAVPPLVTGWPPKKMPWTGFVMNLCIFGAVAVGPTIGAFQLAEGGWRPLFWSIAGIGAVAVAFSLLTYEDVEPKDRTAPWDFVALSLAALGCGAGFFGAGELETAKSLGPVSLVPLCVGFALVVVLVVYEYRIHHPLMPIRQLATTLPVAAVWIALFASASAFGLMELVLFGLQRSASPVQVALLFLPEFAAAALTAVVFGVLFRTRYTPLLALGGLVFLAAGSGVFLAAPGGGTPSPLIALGAGLTGLGVGASVSPALFIAAFSLRSSEVQRVFALIELLRGVTAFLVAPILLFLATVLAASQKAGLRDAIWICFALALAGLLGGAALMLAGGSGLQVPDLDRWQGNDPAWESPPLLSRLGASRQRPRRTAGARSDGRAGQERPVDGDRAQRRRSA